MGLRGLPSTDRKASDKWPGCALVMDWLDLFDSAKGKHVQKRKTETLPQSRVSEMSRIIRD